MAHHLHHVFPLKCALEISCKQRFCLHSEDPLIKTQLHSSAHGQKLLSSFFCIVCLNTEADIYTFFLQVNSSRADLNDMYYSYLLYFTLALRGYCSSARSLCSQRVRQHSQCLSHCLFMKALYPVQTLLETSAALHLKEDLNILYSLDFIIYFLFSH